MRQSVGTLVELAIAQALFTERQRRRVRGVPHLGFDQLLHGVLQWEVGGGGVPAVEQGAAFAGRQHIDLTQGTLGRLGKPGQQRLQASRQPGNGASIELRFHVAELECQLLAHVNQQRQRVVGAFMAVYRTKAQLGRLAVLQRFGDRVVFEHQDVVEQGFTALPGPALDIKQRRVFMLTQRTVLCLYPLQPLRNTLLSGWASNDRQCVDKQADLLLDAFELCRAPRHRRAEGYRRLATVALQQQQPRRLHQRIERDLAGPREITEVPGLRALQGQEVIAITAGGYTRVRVVSQRLRQARGLIKQGQLFAPIPLADISVLGLQPADVIAVAPGCACRRLAAVALQHFAEQLGAAPAVHQQVMAGEDQVVPCSARTYQLQVEQRRLREFKPLLALAGGQFIEVALQRLAALPIVQCVRQIDLLEYHLNRLLQLALPDETAAQAVMRIQRRLPGLAQTLRIKAVDIQTHLIDVVHAIGLIQRMEQHALLHRRQWVDVLDTRHRDRQRIQLSLVQACQREVRWRHPLVVGAVFDQANKFLLEINGQALNARGIKHLRTEAPVHTQFPGVHLAIERQPVAQWSLQAVFGARLFAGWRKQRALGLVEAAIELAQVVEGDARCRQCPQGLLHLFVAQVTKRAEPNPFLGNRAQLLLDAFDRISQGRGRRKLDREQAGEPTHGTCQVQVVKYLFTAMTLHLNQRGSLPRPAANHSRKRRQQHVVDLSPVGRGRHLQQLSRLQAVQATFYGVGVTALQAAIGTLTR
ncbi:hypothetical protein [Pseudomonas sp. 22 E 5]|nr:hypothetical protein [Pseudomonas sp. 22 E 5]